MCDDNTVTRWYFSDNEYEEGAHLVEAMSDPTAYIHQVKVVISATTGMAPRWVRGHMAFSDPWTCKIAAAKKSFSYIEIQYTDGTVVYGYAAKIEVTDTLTTIWWLNGETHYVPMHNVRRVIQDPSTNATKI